MDNTLFKEIWIKAPIEEVFACFTKEEEMLKWHGGKVELNPVPGGIYKVIFKNGDSISGEYIEVLANERVIYLANYGEVETRVEVTLSAEKDGTLVRIKQKFQPDIDRSNFSNGWDYFTNLLKGHLEGVDVDKDCEY